MASEIRLLPGCLLLGFALLASMPAGTNAVQEQEKPSTEEKLFKEGSRKLFNELHCQKPEPVAVKAFLGCWRIAQSWSPPTDENLKLGMRGTESSFQLLLDSEAAQHEADSKAPRYCSVQGRSAVAPYPDPNFEEDGAYAYVLQDLTPALVERMTSVTSQHSEDDRKIIAERAKTLRHFASRGGKYIQTFIVMGRDNVWWDMDGEEDFWALPVPCDGWEKVQEKLRNLEKDS